MTAALLKKNVNMYPLLAMPVSVGQQINNSFTKGDCNVQLLTQGVVKLWLHCLFFVNGIFPADGGNVYVCVYE